MPARLLSRVSTRDRNAVFLFAVAAYALFSILDVLTTLAALAVGLRERNALGSSIYQQYGPAGLWMLKGAVVAVVIVAASLLPRRIAIWLLTLFAVLVAAAVVGNISVLAQAG